MDMELEPLADKIMDYECGVLPPLEIIPLFQRLIDTGIAWRLQGDYPMQAMNLIDRGFCIRGLV